ncbi:MAG: hypothetical protein LBJ21_05710 [Acidobacteriota bacterium]|nr:hypothetical protein [Acidobacteriota bacterium]
MSVATAAIIHEKLNIPTVSLHYDEMLSVAEDTASTTANAMPTLRQLSFDAAVRIADQAPALARAVIDGLTRPLDGKESYAGTWEFTPEPRYLAEGIYEEVRYAMEGDLTRCATSLAAAQFTDGSPVALPTEKALKEMLKGTSKGPGAVVGPIQPNNNMATVEHVAIAGIMAGLKPETMPLLLALTECMANTHDFGSSLGGADGYFAFGAVINGLALDEMKINTGAPAGGGPAPLTTGVPANTGIGRFMRLIQINIGGTEPGIFEAKGLGNPFKTSIVIGEANMETGWPGMSSVIARNPSAGDNSKFGPKDSTVSLFVLWGDMLLVLNSQYSGTAPAADVETPPAGYNKEQWTACRTHLSRLVERAKNLNCAQQGLVAMIRPATARNLVRAGVTREMAIRWISDYCNDTNQNARTMGLGSGIFGAGYTVQGENMHAEWDNKSWLPPVTGEGAQPDAIVKFYPNTKLVNIIVGPGLTYSGLVMNGLPRWTASIDAWR